MKPTHSKKWLVMALLLANGWLAGAQSTNVPGPTDYAAFSRFITERNIFNPSRYPRLSSTSRRSTYHAPVSRSTPAFTLVGIMDYHKGLFAFFDGNNSDLRKVLGSSDTNSIAGYTVAEFTPNGVKLQTADKKQTLELKIGDQMRQAGNEWQLAGPGEPAPGTAERATPEAAIASPEAAAASASAGEPNDILKKLMEKRAKELQ